MKNFGEIDKNNPMVVAIIIKSVDISIYKDTRKFGICFWNNQEIGRDKPKSRWTYRWKINKAIEYYEDMQLYGKFYNVYLIC